MHIGKNGIAAVILAGGESRRMGRDKARIEWGAGSLLTDAVARVGASFDTVALSVRDADAYPDCGLQIIADAEPGTGPLCAVASGLAALDAEWIMAVACDMPFVGADEWSALSHAADNDLDAVVPRNADGLQPLCALYHRRCLEPFRASLGSGELALHAALAQVRVRILDFDSNGHADPFLNVNTPDGLRLARERAAQLAEARA